MKKTCFALALVLATTTLNLLPAQAVSVPSTTTALTAFPNDPNWNNGYSDAYLYVQDAKAMYGQGTTAYDADIDAAIIEANNNRQAANSAGDNAGYMYWSGYWTGLRVERNK